MKKVVFRRRSQKAPVRIYMYDQQDQGILDSGSRRDFWLRGSDDSWSSLEAAGTVRLRHVWGRLS